MKTPDKKLPVEVRGDMSPNGADRVGMLMAITMLIEKLWWKIAIVIILLVFGLSDTYAFRIDLAAPGRLPLAQSIN
ncbi:MAG: hypothetical protein B0W54_07880 [Cellvibrio sp. 79]|nr:MAG: hypothetical protein B0W54_07880 [Cellvibrio sp. 79]